jgi:ATP dependent helicase, Lhr family
MTAWPPWRANTAPPWCSSTPDGLAERITRHLSDRLGKEAVAAHHGSLAKELRLDAEQRLKNGQLQVLVATASLELGIDIGDIDLVCQIASPGSIAALLQRVGRAGHQVDGVPKGACSRPRAMT